MRTAMVRTAPHLVDLAAAEWIDREFRPVKRTRWRPAEDFDFPAETLRRFAGDPDPWMRSLAPRDLDLPGELADDTDGTVRVAVAGHRNLPVPTLVRLLEDEQEPVVSGYLPVGQMERLLDLAAC